MAQNLAIAAPRAPRQPLLDRLISAISPQRGLERARARTQMQIATAIAARAYDGASYNRSRAGIVASMSGSNAMAYSLVKLRDRSRDLARNSPYAKAALECVVKHEIGHGIRPRSNTGRSPVDKRRQAAWTEWAETTQCDFEGRHDVYGLQALARRTIAESGEVLIRFRYVPVKRGLSLPFQLQLLEPDYLDHGRDGPLENGGCIIQGVEFSVDGQRAAYWLFEFHPADSASWGVTGPRVIRVPAAEIVHVYRQTRPGQVRGVPELHAAITTFENMQDLDEAWNQRLKGEACMAGFITESNDGQPPPQLGPVTVNENGDEVQTLSPGALIRLKPGQSITTLTPSSTGGQIEYARLNLRGVAAATGLGYDQVSADVSQANFSSIRTARIELRRKIEQSQWHMLIPAMCQPIWAEFCRIGYLASMWKDIAPTADWIPPKFELIDPAADIAATTAAVRSGFITQAQAIAEMGYDPDTQIAEIARTNSMLDAAGVVLDTDPRRTSQQGQGQTDAVDAAEDEDAAEGEPAPSAPVKKAAKRRAGRQAVRIAAPVEVA